jgi:hypothetical protein
MNLVGTNYTYSLTTTVFQFDILNWSDGQVRGPHQPMFFSLTGRSLFAAR